MPASTTVDSSGLQPDVGRMLDMMAELGLPPLESLPVAVAGTRISRNPADVPERTVEQLGFETISKVALPGASACVEGSSTTCVPALGNAFV